MAGLSIAMHDVCGNLVSSVFVVLLTFSDFVDIPTFSVFVAVQFFWRILIRLVEL